MRLFLLDADYTMEDNKPTVRLFCKDERNKAFTIETQNFEPYFYLKPRQGKTSLLQKRLAENMEIKHVEKTEKILNGEKTELLKVVVEKPTDVSGVRDSVKTWEEIEEEYEYTIPFVHRYLLDKGIEPGNWIIVDSGKISKIDYDKTPELKLLAFDLELAEEDEEKIIMISITDSSGLKKVLTTHAPESKKEFIEVLPLERDMIARFTKITHDTNPDIIFTYNGDDFDFRKLRERAGKLNVPLTLGKSRKVVKFIRRGRVSSAKITGSVHIDLYNFTDHILSPSLKTEVKTLDAVAQELIGEGKAKVKYKEISEAWKTKLGLVRIIEYALQDAELTLKLGEHLLPQIFSIARLVGALPFDASRYMYSQLVENYLMKMAVATNALIPNRPKYDQVQERKSLPVYRGAIVIEPKRGIHSDILVFDFRSLYPTIIVTHNISPDTLNCEHKECKKNIVPELGYHFCTKNKGFIPAHLEKVIKKRQEVKKNMNGLDKNSNAFRGLDSYQYALKIIANATYGYFAYAGSRWYCRACAESCTAWERHYIEKIITDAKENGFEIIYSDTDSIFIRVPEVEEEKAAGKGKKWLEKINEKLPGTIELEFRGLYKGGIFVARKGEEKGAKKRYALIDYDGNLEIRGFETVRKDWCQLAKDIQHEVLRIILQEKNPDTAVNLVRNTVKKIKEGKAKIDELTIYTQLTMPLKDYKQIGPHVKVAMKIKERGGVVAEGMNIEYVVTKGKGSISDRSEPADDVKEGEYDPDYYINNQVLPAAMRVLQALDITEKQVLSGKVQAKLGDWFKTEIDESHES